MSLFNRYPRGEISSDWSYFDQIGKENTKEIYLCGHGALSLPMEDHIWGWVGCPPSHLKWPYISTNIKNIYSDTRFKYVCRRLGTFLHDKIPCLEVHSGLGAPITTFQTLDDDTGNIIFWKSGLDSRGMPFNMRFKFGSYNVQVPFQLFTSDFSLWQCGRGSRSSWYSDFRLALLHRGTLLSEIWIWKG